MPIRKTNFLEGTYYHVYNRGVDKRIIFYEDLDYLRFLFSMLTLQLNTQFSKPERYISRWFKTYKKEGGINLNQIWDPTMAFPAPEHNKTSLIAFALMPNHFHFLLQENQSGGISLFMQCLLNSYTKFFNTKNQRSGHLFQGPFQAVEIQTDEQMEYVSAYIHRNPREIKYWTRNEHRYPWSSFQDYIGENRWGVLLNTSPILTLFKTKQGYKLFVEKSGAKQFDWELPL